MNTITPACQFLTRNSRDNGENMDNHGIEAVSGLLACVAYRWFLIDYRARRTPIACVVSARCQALYFDPQ
jgi:hypothetical protein